MIKNIIILTLASVSVLALSFIGYEKYVDYVNSEIIKKVESKRMSLEEYKEKKEVKEALELIEKSNYKEAGVKFNSIAEKSTDKSEKSMALVDEANMLYKYDKVGASKKYVELFNSVDTLQDIKALSGLDALQMYKSENNLSYLQAFFPGRILDPVKAAEYEYEANKKVYSLYPFGILAARMGLYEISNNPGKENARSIYLRYMPDIKRYLEDSKDNKSLKSYEPNTLLNRSNLLYSLSKYDAANQSEVKESFEASYVSSKVNDSDNITKSFINLTYADYLLSQKDVVGADKLIEEFKTFPESDTIKSYFKNSKYMLLEDDIYVYKYVTKSPKHSSFFKDLN